MGFAWSAKAYKGRVHGWNCCFSRRYDSFIDLNAADDFGDLASRRQVPQSETVVVAGQRDASNTEGRPRR
jgi:hypothetical protein